ncbi:hypothetical protein DL240_08135 [Lujinxingia litoralis]|uniref:Protein kinase domain-containing protein n=1 Tax=Lujinxingia litoralis TaxID=2211119 RepID=A0A328C5J7_9DELT|nr:serine/threonine-protein kinase [Lujinxingia litoralis]RAL22851.1 hypothetical protein DL240_08135 [Lujinxingia litoralis]
MDAGDVLEQGKIIGGKYCLEELIGRGGFSNVYRGVHMSMDRRVAVKVFDPTLPANQDPERARRRAERFEREARLVSQLTHPNTVTIYDYGVDHNGVLYLVMEYIDGVTLKRALADRGPFDEHQAVSTFLQILSSLEEAHHRNMLHRDLKPANIMLAPNFKGEEVVKVLDFGIARIMGDSGPELGPNGRKLFLGTPRYAPPEQLQGQELTFAADIFAVGALFYEALVGEPMIQSSTLRDCALEARATTAWTLPPHLRVRPALAAVIERAVSKAPAQRYASASEMLRALEACEVVASNALPDPTSEEESRLGTSGPVMDPNVLDPDQSENYFLWASQPRQQRTSPPPSPARTSRSGPHAQHRAASGGHPRPNLEELELDLPNPAPRRAPSDRTSSGRQEALAPRPPQRRHRMKVALGVLALAGALAAALLLRPGTLTEPAPQPSAAAPAPQPPATARPSVFTTDGILLAARSGGWRVVDARDPVTLEGLSYDATLIARQDATLELTVYRANDSQALHDILAAISPPDLHVVLDFHVARIHPRDASDTDDALALVEHLSRYRELVFEQTRQASQP